MSILESEKQMLGPTLITEESTSRLALRQRLVVSRSVGSVPIFCPFDETPSL